MRLAPFLLIGLGVLAGCAGTKDLKAPCADRGETAVSAYLQERPARSPAAFAALDACGELKPIN